MQTTTRKVCIIRGGFKVSGSMGYLASSTPIEEGVGTIQCPWIIQVHSGQRINITLYAFGTDQHYMEGQETHDTLDNCGSDIIISDSGRKRRLSACVQLKRERLLYISDGSAIEAYVENRNPTIRTNFVLKYEGMCEK